MITLVQMPFADIATPALGLGLLKAALARSGFAARVVHANLLLAARVGADDATLPLRFWTTSLLGDWVFSAAAFPHFEPDSADYLRDTLLPYARLHAPHGPEACAAALEARLRRLRALAPAFVDEVARAVLATGPAIVGCGSVYAQQTASLALLRRVRELSPGTLTLIGGPNVEGPMGAAVLRWFPWVDLVCSGEGDVALVELCRAVGQRGREALTDELPPGVSSREMAARRGPGRLLPRATVDDLDALPVPDFSDYYAQAARSGVGAGQAGAGVLPIETSRGCEWGRRSACTFCGLNLGARTHRAKSAPRALAELEELHRRHGATAFALADNLVPGRHFSTLFPLLAGQGAPYQLFCEVRPTLRAAELRGLAAAGVSEVQAGVEALDDGLLALMRKGTTALQNIAFLRDAAQCGIAVGWNLLSGLPRERDEGYAAAAALVPLLHHLAPPTSVHGVTLQRFSPYVDTPGRFGLSLRPYATYFVVYPLPEEALMELAYYFRDVSWPEVYPEMNRQTDAQRRFHEVVAGWTASARAQPPPRLWVDRGTDGALHFTDTRACAPGSSWSATGLAARVYEETDAPVRRCDVQARLAGRGIEATPAGIDAALDLLIARRVVAAARRRVVALAVARFQHDGHGLSARTGCGLGRSNHTPLPCCT